jgi:uncharacterized iron-regulated membrane protein
MRRVLSLWIFDWRKLLAYSHRWLGIALGLLFVAWFISGVVMMYARMPGMANEERLARADVLDLSTVTLSAAHAAEQAAVENPGRVQVGMLLGRPVYRFGGRDQIIVFADTGEFFEGVNQQQALEVARRYAPGYTGEIRFEQYVAEPYPDQWALGVRGHMPLYRFALDDEQATRIYVAEATGEVPLRTTRTERFWGYLGPVFHWVYFTPLRRNQPLWYQFVVWSSLIGAVMCIIGIIWGLWRYSPRKVFRLKRVPSVSPYAGWMKWHHVSGLIFGVISLTWAYSGLLSMGPFNWFRSPQASRAEREASTGGPLEIELLTIDSMRAAVAAIEPSFAPKELETLQFRGEPHWVAYRAPTEAEAVAYMQDGLLPRAPRPRMAHRYVSAVNPAEGTTTTFERERMPEIARAAMPGVAILDEVWLTEYDGYYYDLRSSRPLPVLRVRYQDESQTWLYLDPERGGVVQRSTEVSRLRRWLYQGLHSLDFPFLYFKRPLWDIVVIALSIGGTVLSFTTLLPAYRRLKRHTITLWGRIAAYVAPRAHGVPAVGVRSGAQRTAAGGDVVLRSQDEHA